MKTVEAKPPTPTPAPAVYTPATVAVSLPVVVPIGHHKEQIVPNEFIYSDLLNDGVANEEVLQDLLEGIETDVAPVIEPVHQVDHQSFEDITDIDEIEMFKSPRTREVKERPPRFKMPDLSPQKQSASSEASTGSSMYFSLREGK